MMKYDLLERIAKRQQKTIDELVESNARLAGENAQLRILKDELVEALKEIINQFPWNVTIDLSKAKEALQKAGAL